jgi:hypothetical protein
MQSRDLADYYVISPLILVSDAGRQLLYLSSKGLNLVVSRVFSQNRCRAVAVAVL